MEAVSVNLIATLALYQHRRDSAIGLAHITAKQRGLIWYYNTLERQRQEKIAGYIKSKIILNLTKHGQALSRRAKQTKNPGRQQKLMLEAAVLLRQIEELQND